LADQSSHWEHLWETHECAWQGVTARALKCCQGSAFLPYWFLLPLPLPCAAPESARRTIQVKDLWELDALWFLSLG
jgi:hypothetical protein